MNFLYHFKTVFADNFKLPVDNEWAFMPSNEWQFDYKIRVETSPTCVSNYIGTKYWCLNGVVHRSNDLPARINSTRAIYYHMSVRHRSGGPACISDCMLEWYLRNTRIVSLYRNETTDDIINYINSKVVGDTTISHDTIREITKDINSYLCKNMYSADVGPRNYLY